ncbi:VPLPA-CTERM sorting domain-containing protein [uncultured Roseobacter sp.]|uniref:VPLPA-CTERM sorting domain-containing protein n=1 Tax=uncultured Roseobacter sp. TaxID=114847 RepID=UPI002614EC59|nr:VPLPA-CTERM sorting domain-containing protein [uncultured Roseobacter sp.]
MSLVLVSTSFASAAPVDANSIVYTDLILSSSADFVFEAQTASTALFDTAALTAGGEANATARVDLSTGELGTDARVSALAPGSSFIDSFAFSAWNEFVTFSADASIAFSLRTDGRLSTAGASDFSEVGSSLNVYDVTDQTTVFDGTLLNSDTISNRIFTARDLINVSGTSINPLDRGVNCRAANVACLSGNAIDQLLDTAITGTLSVQAGRTYLFGSSLFSAAGRAGPGVGPAASDFLSTAVFAFDDLDGASFTSSSGEFLSANQLTPVPLPAGFPLLLGALAGLAFLRRR